jgi:hypothetical protein
MRLAALLSLSMLVLAGCKSQPQTQTAAQLQAQYNAAYPTYAKNCLSEDYAGAAGMMTGAKLTPEQFAAHEAARKAQEARCKPEGDRLAQLQRQIFAAQSAAQQ